MLIFCILYIRILLFLMMFDVGRNDWNGILLCSTLSHFLMLKVERWTAVPTVPLWAVPPDAHKKAPTCWSRLRLTYTE